MASRELKDEEVSQGAKATVIATDGIAVIVNKENTFDDLTSEQIKQIYIGEITTWDELANNENDPFFKKINEPAQKQSVHTHRLFCVHNKRLMIKKGIILA